MKTINQDYIERGDVKCPKAMIGRDELRRALANDRLPSDIAVVVARRDGRPAAPERTLSLAKAAVRRNITNRFAWAANRV